MKEKEIMHIIIAIIVFAFVSGFMEVINLDIKKFSLIAVFGAIIIGINIISKKIMASKLDASVEHEIWNVERFGMRAGDYIKNGIVAGVIFPLFTTLVTLGSIKLTTFLTYETSALKRRAAKRWGPYNFTEMTDWHNALVGGAGVASSLLISFISYWIPGDSWVTIGKMAVIYAFWNMIPVSKLDGAQIFFGSRPLWTVLGVITLIFLLYAMLLF